MNFIRIKSDGKMKKIVFKPQYKDLEAFKEVVSDITSISVTSMSLSFKDIEDELIRLVDNHDMEYFLE